MKMRMSADNDVISSDELTRQAWGWLRLLSSRQVSDEEISAFRRWVKSSAAHQATYNDVKAKWDALKPLTGTLLHADPGLVEAYKQRVRHRQALSRRAFLGLGAATVAAAGVMMVNPPLGLWPTASEWRADYRTATGEQRTLALSDRIDVTLNTRTSVSREMVDGQTVGLNLIAGEAAVDLARDGHPFTVIAGAGRSLAQSGRLEVRYLEDKVCVTCLSGSARVEHPASVHTLQARQQIRYNSHAVSSIAYIDPAVVSAWRNGILIFRQTRLADVLAEINRYRPGRVMLLNDAVRNQAVTGHFEIAALDRAVMQLQYMFNLQAKSLVGGILLLS
jgi:transmembrane sensor